MVLHCDTKKHGSKTHKEDYGIKNLDLFRILLFVFLKFHVLYAVDLFLKFKSVTSLK